MEARRGQTGVTAEGRGEDAEVGLPLHLRAAGQTREAELLGRGQGLRQQEVHHRWQWMRLEGKGRGWQLQGQKQGSPQNYQLHQQPQPETKAGQGGKQAEGRQSVRRQRKVAKEMKSAQREERQRGR